MKNLLSVLLKRKKIPYRIYLDNRDDFYLIFKQSNMWGQALSIAKKFQNKKVEAEFLADMIGHWSNVIE